MHLLRRVLKYISITVISLVITVGLVVALFWGRRVSSEQTMQQQLSALDQQFNDTRGEIPPQANAELFFPEKIGIFHRESDDEYISAIDDVYRQCRDDNDSGVRCRLFSTYESSDDNAFSLYVSISEMDNEANLSDKVANKCGDSGDKTFLRTFSRVPYLYHTNCDYGYFFIPSGLMGVSWQNNNWFIHISGSYDIMSQFIAAYPY